MQFDAQATSQTAQHVVTIAVAAKNAGTTALSCFLILLLTAYQSSRTQPNDFDVIGWMIASKNRFAVGLLILIIFSALTVLTPDVNSLLQLIGFNTDAVLPVSFGAALAAFLLGGVSKNKPV